MMSTFVGFDKPMISSPDPHCIADPKEHAATAVAYIGKLRLFVGESGVGALIFHSLSI